MLLRPFYISLSIEIYVFYVNSLKIAHFAAHHHSPHCYRPFSSVFNY